MSALGWHWMARASDCPSLTPSEAERAIRVIVAGLGLRALGEPTARATETGVAAVVLLAESHLALHSVRATGEVFLDLFSCVPFPTEDAARLAREALGTQRLHSELLERR